MVLNNGFLSDYLFEYQRRKFCMRYIFLAIYFLLWVSSVSAQPPIQIIYFQPSDIEYPNQHELDLLREAIVEVQSFFASEMDRHGFGLKTFDFNQEISIVQGKLRADNYAISDTLRDEVHEIDWGAVEQNKIEVVFVAGIDSFARPSATGVAYPICWTWPGAAQDPDDCNYLIGVPIEGRELYFLPVIAHEIAHAFGISSHSSVKLEGLANIMQAKGSYKIGVKEELSKYGISYSDATRLNKVGRLSVQPDMEEIDADVNGDGYVDLSDVLIVRSAIQNAVSYDTDVNNDGRTDEIDVLIVKAKAVEAIAAAAPMLLRKRRKVGTWGGLKGGSTFER